MIGLILRFWSAVLDSRPTWHGPPPLPPEERDWTRKAQGNDRRLATWRDEQED